MDVLARQYARLAPFAHLQSPSAFAGGFNTVHDVLLNKILLDAHLLAYPPAPEYQLKFWKWAVQELEALIGDEVSLQVSHRVVSRGQTTVQDIEIDTRVYENLMELIQSVPSSQLLTGDLAPPSPSYLTYYLQLCPETPNMIHRVTLLESRTTIEQGTTGLKTWPAAHALAEWLGKHPGLPRLFSFRDRKSDNTVLVDRARSGEAGPRVGIRRGISRPCYRSHPARHSKSRGL